MPFVIMFVGFALVAAAMRNTQSRLGQLLSGDLTGPNNFFYWIAAISIIGAVGYIPGAQKISRAFLLLVLVVMIMSDKGFFKEFLTAIETSTPTPAIPIDGGGADSGNDVLGGIGDKLLGQGKSLLFSGAKTLLGGIFPGLGLLL